MGKLLNEACGKYGDNIIDEYSKKLVLEVGKKYSLKTRNKLTKHEKLEVMNLIHNSIIIRSKIYLEIINVKMLKKKFFKK